MAAVTLFVVDPGVQTRHSFSSAEGANLPRGQFKQVCCEGNAYWPALQKPHAVNVGLLKEPASHLRQL